MKIHTSWIDYRLLNKVLKTLNCIIFLLRASGNLWKQKHIWQNNIYSDYTIKNKQQHKKTLQTCLGGYVVANKIGEEAYFLFSYKWKFIDQNN